MANEKKFITCDGNYAASNIAYLFSEHAAIYPITPSSTMAENIDEWAAHGKKNLWGEIVKVTEMQSEAGAAGAVHGSLQGGALTSTFTASQGLLLMIPNMYKIAGEMLPTVFHVSARALASHALSIFGDHQDVMACRQTGFAMIASGSVQEAQDIAAVAHLSAIKSSIPFLHFFDGFRTSHEIQKIEALPEDKLKEMVSEKALARFRERALNPDAPVTRGTAQNGDVYFQAVETRNQYYEAVPDIVARYMGEISELTGRSYRPFEYYGDPTAENIIVAMGSVTETIKETIDYLAGRGRKFGLVTVHLYRPFSEKYFFSVLPKSVRRIAVLDRTKEPGAVGEPLFTDVKALFQGKDNVLIIGGRYGLSSKDTTPAQIVAVFDNLEAKEPKADFTIGIVDDVTFKSLPIKSEVSIVKPGTTECKFYGLGSDGTVGANKNTIKIIGTHTNLYSQAYFDYDSKKSGGYTCSHLRFGQQPIKAPYLVNTPDFVACHVPSYLKKYDVLKGIKEGGTLLLNSLWDEEETIKNIPDNVKAIIGRKHIKVYIINATKIAAEIGLGGRTNTILQSAFFKITGIIPYEDAVKYMKDAIVKSYGKKGENVVNMNYAAVDRGGEYTEIKVPAEWATLTAKFENPGKNRLAPAFVKDIADIVNAQAGDTLPVSAFLPYADGTMPAGTSAYEKRGVAVTVPTWDAEKCIQCNNCAFVCPHAAIRPFLLTEEEAAKVPAGLKLAQGKANLKDYKYAISVSVDDCTGCGNCVDVCLAKDKALSMVPYIDNTAEQANYDYLNKYVGYKEYVDKKANMKNSQFAQPLFEFSGACAGCGETPNIKAITQLFGDHMMIANATGCSSIYGASFPASPYCTNAQGHGPAWANSLFEDFCEFGLGMKLGSDRARETVQRLMLQGLECSCCTDEMKALFTKWLENKNDAAVTREVADKLVPLMEKCGCDTCKALLEYKHFIPARSQWIFGGDGASYDIGYGGLDHVLASGENVNVLVLDTEVYSNTGGQSSKATPVGAIAKFAASGKKIRKKDLGMMAISYGYVYVAQVAMGASPVQFFNAIKEAEAYDGPSLIIAYSPCINHGLKAGMGLSQKEEKLAVECGYWHLYRYNPALEGTDKPAFSLDSKEPDWSKFQDFLKGEVRFASLYKMFPDTAEELLQKTEEFAKVRLNTYKRLAGK
ncbi:MAG: pyruvate:ferredoxin (flavodoxin) oxidoreductase [Bacteroidales bacterium]|nr:pyruvate:ferredoxin (flavodoxin) oxidoreductase [Bacteroidales bacterium]